MDGDVVKVELRGEGRWFSSSALTKWPLREGQIPFRLFFPSNDIYKKLSCSTTSFLYFICKKVVLPSYRFLDAASFILKCHQETQTSLDT